MKKRTKAIVTILSICAVLAVLSGMNLKTVEPPLLGITAFNQPGVSESAPDIIFVFRAFTDGRIQFNRRSLGGPCQFKDNDWCGWEDLPPEFGP